MEGSSKRSKLHERQAAWTLENGEEDIFTQNSKKRKTNDESITTVLEGKENIRSLNVQKTTNEALLSHLPDKFKHVEPYKCEKDEKEQEVVGDMKAEAEGHDH